MKKVLAVALCAGSLLASDADRLAAEKARREFSDLMAKAQQAQAQSLNFQLQANAFASQADAKAKEAKDKVEKLSTACKAPGKFDEDALECKSAIAITKASEEKK